jgi:hypothetical protein
VVAATTKRTRRRGLHRKQRIAEQRSDVKIDEHEIDLDFIEHEAEDHLTAGEVLVLGLEMVVESAEAETEWRY